MNQSGMEMALIGTVLNDNSLIKQSNVTELMFTNSLLGKIWGVISTSVTGGHTVDFITLYDDLRDQDELTLTDLLEKCMTSGFSSVMAETYGFKIVENYQTREVIRIANELIAKPDSFNTAIRELMTIGQTAQNFDLSIKQVLTLAMAHVEEVSHHNGITGITTGLSMLDKVLGGFQNSDLVVIAARPAMGKSAVMLNMLTESKCSAGVFSAEMGRIQIGERLLSITSGVEAQKIRMGTINERDCGEMANGSLKLIDSNIRINDKPAPTLDEIINQARKWKFEHDIKIIFFDYLQRIKFKGSDPRHEKVGEGARMFKELARELDIPVVVLAQVNRNADGRRPGMADLAQSGEVECEADQIIFLYRDEVYNRDTNNKGIIEFLISKNRHGAIGDVKAAWLPLPMRIKDLSYTNYT
ncbi:helicase DnaB [Candidatus Pacearchaeota archaeon]|nr:helicase DnaB [Candidatus Pacearchaeota archaeon]